MAVTLAEVEGQALLGHHLAAAELYPDVAAVLDTGVVLRPPGLRIVRALAGLAAGLSGDPALANTYFDPARRLAASLPHLRQMPDIDVLHALSLVDVDAERARSLLAQAVAATRPTACRATTIGRRHSCADWSR